MESVDCVSRDGPDITDMQYTHMYYKNEKRNHFTTSNLDHHRKSINMHRDYTQNLSMTKIVLSPFFPQQDNSMPYQPLDIFRFSFRGDYAKSPAVFILYQAFLSMVPWQVLRIYTNSATPTLKF